MGFLSRITDAVSSFFRGIASSVGRLFSHDETPVEPVERGYNYDKPVYDREEKEPEEREPAEREEPIERHYDDDDFMDRIPEDVHSSDGKEHMIIEYDIYMEDGTIISGTISRYNYVDDDTITGMILASNPVIKSDDVEAVEYEVY